MKIYIVNYTKIDTQNGCLIRTHQGFLNKKDAVSFESKVRRGLIDETCKGLTYESLLEKNIPKNSEGIIKAINYQNLPIHIF